MLLALEVGKLNIEVGVRQEIGASQVAVEHTFDSEHNPQLQWLVWSSLGVA